MADDFDEGCYSFKDLEAKGFVRGRTDLSRKQREHDFPKPIKSGDRQVVFLRSEVHAWLKARVANRDAEAGAKTPALPQHRARAETERTSARGMIDAADRMEAVLGINAAPVPAAPRIKRAKVRSRPVGRPRKQMA